MTTSTPAAGVRRRLILHAGTHKTASTDIQSWLLRSRSLLEQENVHYRFPVPAVLDFKPLTKAITRGDWQLWRDYLELMARSDGDVLLSAEQFAPRLTQRKTIRQLKRLARESAASLCAPNGHNGEASSPPTGGKTRKPGKKQGKTAGKTGGHWVPGNSR